LAAAANNAVALFWVCVPVPVPAGDFAGATQLVMLQLG